MNEPICSLSGCVLHGKGLGRTLGFPTINIAYPEGTVRLADGVYVAELYAGGQRYRGVLNQGSHPTFAQGAPTVEIHLLNANDDFYGQEVTVNYLCFIRAERRFDSPQALIDQVENDKRFAEQWFNR